MSVLLAEESPSNACIHSSWTLAAVTGTQEIFVNGRIEDIWQIAIDLWAKYLHDILKMISKYYNW